MLRLLLRAPCFLARQHKKNRSTSSQNAFEMEQEGQKAQTLTSQYQQVKQKFQDMDSVEPKDEFENTGLIKTMQFYKKLMEDEKKQKSVEGKVNDKTKIQQKLRDMGTPQQLLVSGIKQTNEKKRILNKKKANKQQSQDDEMYIPQSFQTQKEQILKGMAEFDGNKQQKERMSVVLAQQDLMINEIMKQSNERQIKLGNKKQIKEDKSAEREQKLLLRRQKIFEALQNNQDPTTLKLEVTKQDLLSMKYSPDIIQKAKQYRNKELGYFKKLAVNDEDDLLFTGLNKRKFKDQNDQSKYLQQQKVKKMTLRDLTKLPRENSYETMKGEEGLVPFEDKQFYKQKAERQIRDRYNLTQQDLKIKKSLQLDLLQANKSSDVFLDEVVFPVDAKLARSMNLQESSFGHQKKQTKDIIARMEKLGLDYNIDQIKNIGKQLLFQQKKYLEEQQGFQKFLHKKQKKKNMKKQLKKIHQVNLKDDLDFDKQQQIMSVKQIKESNNVQMLENNYQKIKQYQSQKQSTLVGETSDQRQSRIHHTKTFKNMEGFIAMYFTNGLFNHNVGQLEKIQILQIVPNRTNTVMNVFWNLQNQHLAAIGIIPGANDYQQRLKAEKIKLQLKLKKQSTYISGKMCQFLRLRYGPEIRFHFDTKTKKTKEAIEELQGYLKQIAMVQVEEYMNKGLIKTQKKQIEYYQKLLDVSKGKLHEFNSRKQILNKNYRKMHAEELGINDQKPKEQGIKKEIKKGKKKINPIFQEERTQQQKIEDEQFKKLKEQHHKKKKRSATDKLWDSIDLL